MTIIMSYPATTIQFGSNPNQNLSFQTSLVDASSHVDNTDPDPVLMITSTNNNSGENHSYSVDKIYDRYTMCTSTDYYHTIMTIFSKTLILDQLFRLPSLKGSVTCSAVCFMGRTSKTKSQILHSARCER